MAAYGRLSHRLDRAGAHSQIFRATPNGGRGKLELVGIQGGMRQSRSSWLTRRIQGAIQLGLTGAYSAVKVDPSKYLTHLRRAHGLPVESFRDVYSIHIAALDHVAQQTVSASMKFAAMEGAGLGMGGLLTLLPDMSFLSAITFRTIQKLSLLYGFEYSTEGEIAELWIATASAAGVDIAKDFVKREVIERFVPRVIERIAVKAGSELVEKGLLRLIPVLSAATGGALNYYFVRGWGRRAQRYFRTKHIALRSTSELGGTESGQPPPVVRQ